MGNGLFEWHWGLSGSNKNYGNETQATKKNLQVVAMVVMFDNGMVRIC